MSTCSKTKHEILDGLLSTTLLGVLFLCMLIYFASPKSKNHPIGICTRQCLRSCSTDNRQQTTTATALIVGCLCKNQKNSQTNKHEFRLTHADVTQSFVANVCHVRLGFSIQYNEDSHTPWSTSQSCTIA